MQNNFDPGLKNVLFEFLLRLGDDRLILGHRLSEWCGHAPILEEDIALANIALDCIGQANAFLILAAEVESKNRNEDDLAYFRNEREFKNILLVEQPNTDFAYTIARQFFYDQFAFLYYKQLTFSSFADLKAIAEKSLKEVTYHLRHSKQWILKLGDGTDESHNKIQTAVDHLWIYTGEFFERDELVLELEKENVIPNVEDIKTEWNESIKMVLEEATLNIPETEYFLTGGRSGKHSEHLGHLLAEMQILPRSYPGAKW